MIFKKLKLAGLVLMIVLLVIFSCQKDEKIFLDGHTVYRNLLDSTTTSIQVSIPRIEFAETKSNGGIIVYVSVTDQDGNVLTHFTQHNFDLSYMCKDQMDTINVNNPQFVPDHIKRNHIAVGNTMDYSGSMSGNDIINMERAVKTFVRLKDENDFMQIIKFDGDIQIMNEFTNDTLLLMEVVEQPFGGGFTAYYQAVYEGLLQVDSFITAQKSHFPAMIAFTDGHDNRSQITLAELIEEAQVRQIPIYTVGFGNVDQQGMTQLANETGGHYFYTPTGEQISDLYQTLSGQLHNIYCLQWHFSLLCDEFIIIVEISYENKLGIHKASASKAYNVNWN